MNKTILIFGASGSGKTRLSKEICARFGFDYFHAGSIKKKKWHNFVAHQNQITQAVIEKKEKSKVPIVIDAHNCIAQETCIKIIPLNILIRIQPDLTILLDPKLKNIKNQIENDNHRSRNIKMIKKEKSISRIMFHELVRKYKIHHTIIEEFSTNTLTRKLQNILND